MTKRKCKNIDISNYDFILNAIHECMSHKTSKAYNRQDIKTLYTECDWDEKKIAKLLQSEILNRKLELKPIRYENRIDQSNGKLRRIAIEDIKQQFYDYIAYDGLNDLASYIGHYQIACKDKMGPLFGARVIYSWMQEKDIRYAIKADVKKCYPSITHKNMIKWLRKHVKNEPLLWLINELLNTVEEGLPIGSYLSIRLCALYMADIYHHIERSYFTERRCKKSNVFKHIMFNIDDIYLFGSNAKQMNKAMKSIMQFSSSKGITIKPSYQLINLNPNDKHSHIDVLGYRIYHDHITMRHRDYLKLKKALKRFKSKMTVFNARSLCARHGIFVKHTNSLRFCQKYNVFKYFRKARMVISKHDKSKIFNETASCQSYVSWQFNSVPVMS